MQPRNVLVVAASAPPRKPSEICSTGNPSRLVKPVMAETTPGGMAPSQLTPTTPKHCPGSLPQLGSAAAPPLPPPPLVLPPLDVVSSSQVSSLTAIGGLSMNACATGDPPVARASSAPSAIMRFVFILVSS